VALGAILAAALNTAASRSKALWVGGVDVIYDPLGPTINYAVPIDTVIVDHMGPGGVSSMEFTVELPNPTGSVSIGEGMDVRFYDFTKGWYDFYGFVDHVDVENMDGSVGTRYRVRCTGIEAVLDWSVMPSDLVVPAGLNCDAAAQLVFANAVGTSLGRLHAGANGTTNVSSDALPVASAPSFSTTATVGATFTISAGTTLREALRAVVGSFVYIPNGSAASETFLVTVDFLGGLRFFGEGQTSGNWSSSADQWDFPQIDNDPPYAALSYVGEVTTYGIDAAQVRAVLVRGTGVTQMVVDGTGKEGPVAVLDDSSVTTTAQAIVVGTNYLTDYASDVRGSLELTDWPVWASQSRPGGYFTLGITDARLGLSAVTLRGSEVVKTYNPSGRQNWTVSFGAATPSLAGLTRQLTRTTLS